VHSHSGWLFSRWMIQPRFSVDSRSAELAASAPLPGGGEIARTLALYAHFLDDHDSENWSKLFVADAKFVLGGAECTGRGAIKELVESQWANHPERRIVHFCTTSVVRAESTTATAETEVSEYEPTTDGAWQSRGHGRYYDRLVRSGDRWLIQERRIKFPL